MNCSNQPLEPPSKKKVEIIDIDLGLDLSEEAKLRIDTLDKAITLFTKGLVEREKTRQQSKYSKKKKAKTERQEAITKVVEQLELAHGRGDYWMKGRDLVKHAGLEPTKQNIITLSKQIQTWLKKENKWVLLKTRKLGRTVYRLAKFGD